jgi:hypothetical protein
MIFLRNRTAAYRRSHRDERDTRAASKARRPRYNARLDLPCNRNLNVWDTGSRLSFLLIRLGGFAADYFRGNPSALRAAWLGGARCSGFGEADARLITIGELDAGRLECTLQRVNRRLFRISPIFDARDSIGRDAGLFSELPHAPPDGGSGHPKLNGLHWYSVQVKVDIVPISS